MAAGAIQKLTPIPAIEKLSERVIRILGCNPGPHTLQGTNTYLVGNGKRKLLIDTGSPETVQDYLKHLKLTLQQFETSIQEVIVTHWHHDHVGGVQGMCKNVMEDTASVTKFERLSVPDIDISPAKYTFIKDHHVYTTEGATLRAIHTPGHTEEHMILYMEEENAVFSGDTILGESTAVFEDLHSYMKSLQLILDLKPSVIYPGHGIVVRNPMEIVSYYINHRHEREAQILAALRASGKDSMTSLEIVHVVYEGLNELLIYSAVKNASHHLKKLVKDGHVECLEGDEARWRLTETRHSNI